LILVAEEDLKPIYFSNAEMRIKQIAEIQIGRQTQTQIKVILSRYFTILGTKHH
jgi:hypothetical protein